MVTINKWFLLTCSRSLFSVIGARYPMIKTHTTLNNKSTRLYSDQRGLFSGIGVPHPIIKTHTTSSQKKTATQKWYNNENTQNSEVYFPSFGVPHPKQKTHTTLKMCDMRHFLYWHLKTNYINWIKDWKKLKQNKITFSNFYTVSQFW